MRQCLPSFLTNLSTYVILSIKAIQLFVIIHLQLLLEVSFDYYEFFFEQRSVSLCFYCKQHSSAIFCLEKVVFKYSVYINLKIIFFCQCLLTAKHFIADFKSIKVDVH